MFPYQKLTVYQKAFILNKAVYQLIKKSSHVPVYFRNQLGRACLSIMLNIAEGSAKESVRDRKSFFTTARASAFECASIIEFLASENEITEETTTSLYKAFDEISRILYTMIKNLEAKQV